MTEFKSSEFQIFIIVGKLFLYLNWDILGKRIYSRPKARACLHYILLFHRSVTPQMRPSAELTYVGMSEFVGVFLNHARSINILLNSCHWLRI